MATIRNSGSGSREGGGTGTMNVSKLCHALGRINMNPSQGTPKTALGCKEEGNKLFKAKEFVPAIQMYSTGLDIMDINIDHFVRNVQLMLDLLSNRAAAYLALGCYYKALEDAESVLRLDPSHAKGIYRKVKALAGLQRFIEALSFLKSCQQELAVALRTQETRALAAALANWASEVKILYGQHLSGHYDLVKLFKAGDNARHENFADFTRLVKIDSSPGKGRGLFATKEIQPGQLVLACKAFAVVLVTDGGLGQEQSESELRRELQGHGHGQRAQRGTCAKQKLVQMVGDKIQMEPRLAPLVYDLYAGPEYENAQGVGVGVDLDRIASIWTCDLGDDDDDGAGESDTQEEKDTGTGTGIWVLPSYMNHSCWDCNSLREIVGDVMLIRAFKKISPGEEILSFYETPTRTYSARCAQMQVIGGFECQCSLCQLDRDKSELGRRRMRALLKLDKALAEKNEQLMLKTLDALEKLELVGGLSLKMCPSLVPVLLYLAECNFKRMLGRGGQVDLRKEGGLGREDVLKAVRFWKKCHEMTVDSPLLNFALECSRNLVDKFFALGEAEESIEWTKKMAIDLLMYRGTLDMVSVDAPAVEPIISKFKLMVDGHGVGVGVGRQNST